MFSTEQLLVFITSSTILAISPGPDNLYVMSQSALFHFKAGLMVILGLCTGLIIHSLAVALGVTTAATTLPWLFDTIRYSGAFYIAWLARQAFQSANRKQQLDKRLANPFRKSQFEYYCKGVVMNVLNPKVGLFFLAFYPQFIDIHHDNTASQILVLSAIFIAITLIVFSGYAYLAIPLKHWLNQHESNYVAFHYLTGIMLFGLAIYIAFFNI